jgi:site-specific recombinase XerD
MTKADPFPALLRSFFYEWLVDQRNASVHTVRSYRDTWRLFLRFVAGRENRQVVQLRLADLTAAHVIGFLHHAEHDRHGTIGTRNCRLAAIRSFFTFVASKELTDRSARAGKGSRRARCGGRAPALSSGATIA